MDMLCFCEVGVSPLRNRLFFLTSDDDGIHLLDHNWNSQILITV
jgi:hypothetical protein